MVNLQEQRVPLTLSLVLVVSCIIYIYIFEFFLLVGLLFSAWILYDYIQDYTKETVDPSGKYVFVTGCDSGMFQRNVTIQLYTFLWSYLFY